MLQFKYEDNANQDAKPHSPMTTDRLEKLRQKRAQLDAQIKDAEARARQQSRKDDTRRKIIVGALAIEHMTTHPGSTFALKLAELIDTYVTKPSDRSLLNALLSNHASQARPNTDTLRNQFGR